MSLPNSYQPMHPQAASASSSGNGQLVLITLGVCLASLLELVVMIAGYMLFIGGLIFSQAANQVALQNNKPPPKPPRVSSFPTTAPAPSPNRAPPNRVRPQPPPTGQLPGGSYSSIAAVRVNDRVHILWGNSWWPGTVIEKRANDAKVRYDNYSETFDEYVTVSRLRRMLPSESAFNQPAAARTPIPAPTPPPQDKSAEQARQDRERQRKELEERLQKQREEMLKRIQSSTQPAAPAPAAADPLMQMRTWTDSTGKFSLRAQLIAVENGDVKLQRPDGRIVTMPIDKLSPPDQALVRTKYP